MINKEKLKTIIIIILIGLILISSLSYLSWRKGANEGINIVYKSIVDKIINNGFYDIRLTNGNQTSLIRLVPVVPKETQN